MDGELTVLDAAKPPQDVLRDVLRTVNLKREAGR
jgi:hypothetical protein